MELPRIRRRPLAAASRACLAMIVKNEARILPRLFESVRGFVTEYCIVDTGSTDNTVDVVQSMAMPGVVVHAPFVDFGTTRNALLDACRKHSSCEYLLLMDADMVLRVSPSWDWTRLDDQDAYHVLQISSIEYENVRLVRRTADRIRYVGSTHEYCDVPPEYSKRLLPKRLVYIEDVGDGGCKDAKFERDERLLRREVKDQPSNARAVFYLANTLKDQGKFDEAIPFYQKRTEMGHGWFAEADYSLYMLSTCFLGIGDVPNARRYAEMAAFHTRSRVRRAEPLYYLALYLHRHSEYDLAWYYAILAASVPKPQVSDALFLQNEIYDKWVAFEVASLARQLFGHDARFCASTFVARLRNDGQH